MFPDGMPILTVPRLIQDTVLFLPCAKPRTPVSPYEILVLLAGGLIAGVVNTLAGGGSLLTVPILVLIGLPGTIANGTNRIGILVQCLVATGGSDFHGEALSDVTRPVIELPEAVAGPLRLWLLEVDEA